MYYNKDSYSIHFEKYGEGKKKIVILPGWGDTRSTFDSMIYEFKSKYTVYIMDYPGFGQSIFPDKDLTVYDYTNMIRDFLESENIDNPIIIAHSFGGRIATLLTGYYKDKVDKLILIDSAGIKPRKNPYQIFKTYTYKFLKKLKIFLPKRKRSIYLKRLLHLFGSADYKALDQNMLKTFRNIVNLDLKYYFKNIDVKTLILWGKKDKDTPVKDAYAIHKYIKNSKLYVFPDATHFSYLNYPTMTHQLILNFIEKEST